MPRRCLGCPEIGALPRWATVPHPNGSPSIKFVYSTTDSSGRMMRSRLRLSEYTFDMTYKPGASHHLSDLLSRASTVAPTEDIHDNKPCLALD